MINIRGFFASSLIVPTAAVMLAGPAFSAPGGASSGKWSVGMGAGGGWSPEYRGADGYKAEGLPFITARKGQLSIDPVTGVSYDLLASKNLKFAPTLSYAKGRDNTGALENFEDVHGGAMAGVLASWNVGSWQLNGDVSAAVSGDLDGVRARGYLRYRGQIGNRVLFAAGPGVSWGNNRWNQALFDVSSKDAARSGIRAFQTEGEYLQSSMNGRLTFLVTRKLSVSTVAQYSRLFGDAADSPIVEDVGDANQWHGSLAINYQF